MADVEEHSFPLVLNHSHFTFRYLVMNEKLKLIFLLECLQKDIHATFQQFNENYLVLFLYSVFGLVVDSSCMENWYVL